MLKQNPFSQRSDVAAQRLEEFTPTFFGRVMFCFALAILVSTVGVWFGFTYLLEVFIANQSLIWVVFIAELALIFTSRKWSTIRPLNYILFSLFALLTGITITPLLLMATVIGGIGIVIKALLATFLMFTAAGVIGYTTKKSLEGMRGFLFVSLIGMIIVGVIGIFIPWGSTFEMIYAGIGVLLFTGYTMYDFQRIKRFPQDRYIEAAMHLYLDIFNLFIFILRLILSQRS
ncbi:Bax inhibitor-1 family protein [Patescibacteria group bacterium]